MVMHYDVNGGGQFLCLNLTIVIVQMLCLLQVPESFLRNENLTLY